MPDSENKMLTLDLLNNGIDFVRSGIETYFKEDTTDPTDHKYAVLHMFAGTLLILKARLSKEHPALIYSIPENNHEDAETVGLDVVIKRLRRCGHVRIANKTVLMLDRVRRARNRMEHSAVAIDLAKTQEIIGSLAYFLFRFLNDELDVDLDERLHAAAWNRLRQLERIAKDIRVRQIRHWRALRDQHRKMSFDELTGIRTRYMTFCRGCGSTTVVKFAPYYAICTVPPCREVYGPEICPACNNPLLKSGLHDCRDWRTEDEILAEMYEYNDEIANKKIRPDS